MARRLVALGRRDRRGPAQRGDGVRERRRERRARGAAARGRRRAFGDTDTIVVAGRFERERVRALGRRGGPRALELLQTVVRARRAAASGARAVQSSSSRRAARRGSSWRSSPTRAGRSTPGSCCRSCCSSPRRSGRSSVLVDCAEDAQAGWWEDLLTLFASEIAGPVPVLLVVGVEAARRATTSRAGSTPRGRSCAAGWPSVGRSSGSGTPDLAAWVGRAEPPVARGAARGQRRAQCAGRAAVGGVAGRRRGRARARRPAVAASREEGRPRSSPGGVAGSPDLELLSRRRARGPAVHGRGGRARARARARRGRRLPRRRAGRGRAGRGGRADHDRQRARRTQHLWQYRFVSDLDRLTLRRPDRRRAARRSERLAEGLVAAYGVASDFVAADAGAAVRGRRQRRSWPGSFWARTRLGATTTSCLWRASRLLRGPRLR